MAKWRWGTLCSYFILLLCSIWRAESQPRLYPYGSGTNDRILNDVNDEPVASLELLQDFRFGGEYHRSLYISPNGIISFDEATTKEPTKRMYRNIPFYYNLDDDIADENPDAILAYWTDVDTTGSDKGNIYYRQLDESDSLLEDASEHVRAYFRSNQQFTAQAMVIVTWELVSFYEQFGPLDPRNTFQTALVYDSQKSFVFFLYDQIEWTTGTTLGGDADTGLYGSGETFVIGMPLIGFNMGHSQEKLEFSQNMLLTLDTLTNVKADDGGEAGIFAYKVDGERIIDPACDSEIPVESGRLTLTVTRSSSGSTNWNTAGNANPIAADTELCDPEDYCCQRNP